MEYTPDEIYDQLRELRSRAEQIAENIADVASAIQYFTNNLFDEQHNPDLADHVREIALSLSRLVAASRDQTCAGVERATDATETVINCMLQQVEQSVDRNAPDDVDRQSHEYEQSLEAKSPLPELPEMFAWRLKGLVQSLQAEAKQLASCDQFGKKTAWKWWEMRLPLVRDQLAQLEFLEEKAVGEGMSLMPYIERWGGIPERILADQWPDELIAALQKHEVVEEESSNAIFDSDKQAEESIVQASMTKQRALFDEHSAAGDNLHSDFVGEQDDVNDTHQEAPQADTPQQQTEKDSPNGHVELPVAVDAQLTDPSPEQRPQRPYTLDDYRDFCDRRGDHPMTAHIWRSEYRWLRESKQTFVATLQKNHNATQLKVMASRAGCFDARRSTKQENALSIFRACLRGFVLGSAIQYSPMTETIEDAIDRIVDRLTDEDFAKYDAEHESKRLEHQKAIENPETLAEFALFVREMGEDKLTDEQYLRRDRLYADLSRKTRSESQARTVAQFEASDIEGLEFSLKEGYHDKRKCPVWIVQMSSRVERGVYAELKTKAQQLGGKYSSFKKDEAGFQFFSQDQAELFMGLREGAADRSDHLEDRRIYRMTNTAQRFAAMAERLREQAQKTLAADEDKLKNTVRRAEMAASTRAAARESLASAATLQSLATMLSEGQATYLDGVRYGVQISTLKSLLRRGKTEHNRHQIQREYAELSHWDRHSKQEQLDNRPIDKSDLRFSKYPNPTVYRRSLIEAFDRLRNTKGMKQLTAKLEKTVARLSPGQEHVTIEHDRDIALLEEFLSKANAAGHSCYWLDDCLDSYQRLRKANIHTDHELRAALAELLPHLHPAGVEDPITVALDELRGKDLPGFFPTPRAVIHQMLEYADLQPDDRVLEPSAGCGDILDAVREQFPKVQLQAVEKNLSLAPILAAKGYQDLTSFSDFLESQWRCDKVLMNPPFEQGAEIDHVRHAYEQLALEGRLVSVMSVGPFQRNDKQAKEFRKWLDELEHEIQELPERAFAGVDTFRQTGVRTCLVVIQKR